MVRSLREVTEVQVFLDTLGCSSAHHLKSVGLACDVGFCGFTLLLVTTGWHVREGNCPNTALSVLPVTTEVFHQRWLWEICH